MSAVFLMKVMQLFFVWLNFPTHWIHVFYAKFCCPEMKWRKVAIGKDAKSTSHVPLPDTNNFSGQTRLSHQNLQSHIMWQKGHTNTTKPVEKWYQALAVEFPPWKRGDVFYCDRPLGSAVISHSCVSTYILICFYHSSPRFKILLCLTNFEQKPSDPLVTNNSALWTDVVRLSKCNLLKWDRHLETVVALERNLNEVSCLQIIFLHIVIQKLIGRHNTRSQAKMLIHHIYNLYSNLTKPRNHLYSSYLDVLFPFSPFLLKPFFSSEPSNARKMSHIFVFLYNVHYQPRPVKYSIAINEQRLHVRLNSQLN